MVVRALVLYSGDPRVMTRSVLTRGLWLMLEMAAGWCEARVWRRMPRRRPEGRRLVQVE